MTQQICVFVFVFSSGFLKIIRGGGGLDSSKKYTEGYQNQENQIHDCVYICLWSFASNTSFRKLHTLDTFSFRNFEKCHIQGQDRSSAPGKITILHSPLLLKKLSTQ